MKLTRRRFLRILAGAGLLAASGTILKTRLLPSAITEKEEAVLRSYLDTLIPGGDAPSATELGVDRAFIAQASGNRELRRIVKFGMDWIDTRARRAGYESFYAAPEQDREDVITAARNSGSASNPRAFYLRTRNMAFDLYYADKRSWPFVGYNGPPQPYGNPDYTKPMQAET